jgi:hypothetical protein
MLVPFYFKIKYGYDPDAKQKYNNNTETNVKHGEIG